MSAGMNHIPADIRAAVPKLSENATEEELATWLEALPPCPGIGFSDDEDEESDARAMADLAAGRVYPHEEVSVWLDTWASPDFKPFHEWRKSDWSNEAIFELLDIALYIRRFDPAAADSTAKRLKAAADSLAAFPNRGRPVSGGCRELLNVRPYHIRYHLKDDVVTILRIRHGARRPLA